MEAVLMSPTRIDAEYIRSGKERNAEVMAEGEATHWLSSTFPLIECDPEILVPVKLPAVEQEAADTLPDAIICELVNAPTEPKNAVASPADAAEPSTAALLVSAPSVTCWTVTVASDCNDALVMAPVEKNAEEACPLI
jgi:hypothetical protein